MGVKIELPESMTEKDVLLSIYTEKGFTHLSWKTLDGKIITFEDVEENYPRTRLSIFGSLEEYLISIRKKNWIKEKIDQFDIRFIANRFHVEPEYVEKKLGLKEG